jgi:hypothetical protein
MSGGTITGTVTTAIILGQGQYGTALSVIVNAAVEPSVYGASAIYGPSNLGSATIVNDGALLGAKAGQSNGGAGGDGVLLQAVAYVMNAGSIIGGTPGAGGRGGVGVDLSAGGKLLNSGNITGGYCGNVSSGPLGGAGVLLGAAASVTNSGTMTGRGGIASQKDHTGEAGAGIAFQASGTLTNSGVIVAGHEVRAAAVFDGAAHVTNSGTINGYSSAAGLALWQGGVLANTGMIEGGSGSYGENGNFAINGRAGLLVDGTARIYNDGDVSGGTGAKSLAISDNEGSRGPGSGGIGVVVEGSSSIVDNAGTLTGGAGGYTRNFAAGNGGVGAVIATGNLLVNNGEIDGGTGGAIIASYSDAADTGGAGAVLLGGDLFNLGVISGGAGGTCIAPEDGAAGGAGVFVSSGNLIAAAGTISGGAAASGYTGPSTGLAVAFGNQLAATLVVDPGAVFVGGVEASHSVADTLVLAGTASGSLGGFGEDGGLRNFSDI